MMMIKRKHVFLHAFIIYIGLTPFESDTLTKMSGYEMVVEKMYMGMLI